MSIGTLLSVGVSKEIIVQLTLVLMVHKIILVVFVNRLVLKMFVGMVLLVIHGINVLAHFAMILICALKEQLLTLINASVCKLKLVLKTYAGMALLVIL